MKSGQCHENDIAQVVFLCCPSLPKFMGALHPAGALYAQPVNLKQAIDQHRAFRALLQRQGILTLEVSQVLAHDTETSVNARMDLEQLAAQSLCYRAEPECLSRFKALGGEYYISEEYKRLVLEAMSSDQLTDIVKTFPTVTITPSTRDTGVAASYAFQPLTNLVFTRDQQVTTKKGIVLGRPSSVQREHEVNVMEFCFRKLGFKIIDRIPPPAHLEGGDFFPAGDDLCFIGVGLRTDMHAVMYMLEKDLFGTRKVAVVRDEYDHNQDRMHLDCVFNILSDDCVLLLEDMVGANNPIQRLVDEYVKKENGQYVLERSNIEFSDYLRGQGYSIIFVPGKEQLQYGCNVLNLGNKNIVAVHPTTARRIAKAPCFDGNVEYINMSAITAMYGAAHCASQVVYRQHVHDILTDDDDDEAKWVRWQNEICGSPRRRQQVPTALENGCSGCCRHHRND
ncbi:hypothetical protein GAYE_SCF01G1976 [Galdieria yellowstonensis]|uniref:Arginine deiminase n=1 Tax=Galdieria yellowstonensis TaxID=3028027 RepID=A0AAV9I9L6_9RHOD|nr:hypothetical protein GAYE_SCF01G1976 [Galdieria yellowstonensis]